MEKIKQLVNLIPKGGQEIIKEVLRWFVFGIASLYVLNQGDFDLVWAIKTISLRIIDRLVHIYGKEEDISWLIKGLTRF